MRRWSIRIVCEGRDLESCGKVALKAGLEVVCFAQKSIAKEDTICLKNLAIGVFCAMRRKMRDLSVKLLPLQF